MTEHDHRHGSRRSDRLASLQVAVIATAGALVAAGIGAGASYFTARLQVKSQSQQSLSQFLREQRLVVYSKFVADVRKVTGVESNYALVFRYSTDQIARNQLKKRAEANSEMVAIRTDYSVIQMVGAKKAVSAASHLFAAHYAAVAFLNAQAAAATDGTLYVRGYKTVYREWHERYNRGEAHTLAAFLASARLSLDR